jgi:hypothetical protein
MPNFNTRGATDHWKSSMDVQRLYSKDDVRSPFVKPPCFWWNVIRQKNQAALLCIEQNPQLNNTCLPSLSYQDYQICFCFHLLLSPLHLCSSILVFIAITSFFFIISHIILIYFIFPFYFPRPLKVLLIKYNFLVYKSTCQFDYLSTLNLEFAIRRKIVNRLTRWCRGSAVKKKDLKKMQTIY